MINIDILVYNSVLDVSYVEAAKNAGQNFVDYRDYSLDNQHLARHHEVTAS